MTSTEPKLKWNHGTRSNLYAGFWFIMLGVPYILQELGLLRDSAWTFGSFVLYALSGIMFLFVSNRLPHWTIIDKYTENIETNPADIDAYLKRGYEYQSLSKKKSLEDYSTAIRIAPNDPRAFNRRARLYKDLRQYQHALTDFNEAIRLDPEYGGTKGSEFGQRSIDRTYALRGFVNLQLKKFEDSLADYTAAREVISETEKEDIGYLECRASVYQAAGRPEKAIQDYEMILSCTDESNYREIAHIRKLIAKAYREVSKLANDPELAITALQNANENKVLAARYQRQANVARN